MDREQHYQMGSSSHQFDMCGQRCVRGASVACGVLAGAGDFGFRVGACVGGNLSVAGCRLASNGVGVVVCGARAGGGDGVGDHCTTYVIVARTLVLTLGFSLVRCTLKL